MGESGEPPIPGFSWISSFTEGREPYTIAEMFKLNVEREQFRARAHALWNATASRSSSGRPVDAILTPVAPTLAPPHDSVRWWGYSSYWNLVDYPAAVFPVGRLNAREWQNEHGSVNDLPPARNKTEEFIRSQWDAYTYDNAPISLQVMNPSSFRSLLTPFEIAGWQTPHGRKDAGNIECGRGSDERTLVLKEIRTCTQSSLSVKK